MRKYGMLFLNVGELTPTQSFLENLIVLEQKLVIYVAVLPLNVQKQTNWCLEIQF